MTKQTRDLFKMVSKMGFKNKSSSSTRDIKILGWCPVGPVLPHRENVPL